MADEPGRTFSEQEHLALVNDAVARETAQAQAKIAELEAANADLGTTVDTLETEKAQAISRAEAAEQAHETYKTEVETEKAREAKRSERLAQVASANPHLDLTSLEDEGVKARVERIVAMSDEGFEGYLADMKAVAGQAPVEGAPPRESAAFTPTPSGSGSDKKGTVGGVLAASRALRKVG